MEEQIERLKQQIKTLRHRLIRIEVGKIDAEAWADDGSLKTSKRNRWAVKYCLLVAESEAVQAELTAALVRLAHLNIAAEAERLVKQPSQVERHVREDRERVEKVLERHRKIARRMIRYATDVGLVCDRVNGMAEKDIRERKRKQQELELRQDQGPKQRYRGLSL